MENKKMPIKVIIEDNSIAVRCCGGDWLVGDLDNRWLWVLSAIAFPDENSIEISDRRKNRQSHQKDMTMKGD